MRRRQFKTNADRLRRRRMQRKGETAEQAAAAIPDTVERRPDLPFVQLRSSSTGQPFCLCVEHGPLQPLPVAGAFNAYGLGHRGNRALVLSRFDPFFRGHGQGLENQALTEHSRNWGVLARMGNVL